MKIIRTPIFVAALAATVALLVVFRLQVIGQSRRDSAQEKPTTRGLGGVGPAVHGAPEDPLRDPREIHLRHVKQLTFGGQNAEAYFSYDSKRLVFQSTREPYACDQIFIMNVDGSRVRRISTG